MASHKQRSDDFPKYLSLGKDERFTETSVINEVSKRTGFTKKDIRLVILTFHYVICEEFAAGKRIFRFAQFYKLWSQKIAAKKNWKFLGKTMDIPEFRKIKFMPFSEFDAAVDHIKTYAARNMRNKKKGRE